MNPDLGRCRDEVEIAVFRIVQEGLANVLRHSRSPVAKISLHRNAGWLELTVSDRGKGHAREALMQARDGRSGIGISGMRERVEQLGGWFQINSNEDGTTVMATIPTEVNFHG
jgi:signal transduction histidine kinase